MLVNCMDHIHYEENNNNKVKIFFGDKGQNELGFGFEPNFLCK